MTDTVPDFTSTGTLVATDLLYVARPQGTSPETYEDYKTTMALILKFVPKVVGFTALGSVLTTSEEFGRFTFDEAVDIPAGCTGSQAKAGTASTGTAVISLKKNGSEFGTVTFTSSATGVYAAAASTSFAIGDVLTAVGPASADATLAGIGLTIVCTRT